MEVKAFLVKTLTSLWKYPILPVQYVPPTSVPPHLSPHICPSPPPPYISIVQEFYHRVLKGEGGEEIFFQGCDDIACRGLNESTDWSY